ncbi:hypothetical protein AN3924.2 [Aspergillus nidulans FGSC A4]|uniref:RED-like N-terminal domain-containing protein n=1 Tax=Emericella nidulans (strain FGSC A4 / ATCC 38163 / CBS 112.46 / NRRL 194 / M139) TaxID=227321 RepID=Q5B6A6_EMENI|nr:hypothetical protein [Aspergillus nidulans FGSC A4]EAA59233.1 hypothetical protein AN3924.2 [Aspergillus nidulans FGSC A4]CBF75082.1 TPA: hypothetical protein ANIA_03924 [Aspergillus nidulans FGSC A4]|eukprot:XP_661528.1 hypothetical protein AN3924.2 [Aspergillus nidulans FGSC A4]
MNNEQFRRLLLDNNRSSKSTSASPTGFSHAGKHGAASPQGGSDSGGQTPKPAQALLGSRMRSSIPMTPRTLTAPNFASQLAEYRRERDGKPPPNKKFKSSAAPKGTKLPVGYEDRAAARLRESEDAKSAEREAELKGLEEKFKEGLIDEETLTRSRRELGVGGDLSSTHMVKGLDWDLLRRIKAGEDVERTKEKRDEEGDGGAAADDEPEKEVDVDEEFDKVLEQKGGESLPSAPKGKEKKRGNMAPPPAPTQTQRKTRDEILRELKASRAAASAPAAAQAPESVLGARFKKIGDTKPEKKRFIEQDENGRRREVLLITDADGKTKRKTRWLDKAGTTAPATATATAGDPVSEKEKESKPKPLGMEVPADVAAKIKAAQTAEEEDDDIFEGVGADYNPLGGDGSEDSSESDEEEGDVAAEVKSRQELGKEKTTEEPTMEAARTEPARPRNYFATGSTGKEAEQVESDRHRTNPLTKDPTILAALKRAAALRQAAEGSDHIADDEEGVDKETLLRRKRFLEEAQRREALDAMDLDYGFGGSRIEDDEDDEGIVLESERGGNKRKRGPKKRKGNKDSAADVLGVLEGRKNK